MVVNQRQLAEVFGVSHQSIKTWMTLGLPVMVQADGNVGNQYDTAACIEWRVQQLLGRAEAEGARERRDRLEGDRLEMTIAKESGLVVDAPEIQQLFGSMVVAARAELLGSSAAIKSEADARYGIDFDERIVTDHHEQALARLAGGEDVGQCAAGDGGGVAVVGAPAEDGNAAVGG